MSKTRNKNGSEVEYLRGLVRNLKSENRSLKRRVRDMEKKEHWFDVASEEAPEQLQVHEKVDTCTSCGKGKVQLIDLKHLVISTCDTCGDRRKFRPDGSEIKTKEAFDSKAKRSK